MAACAIRSHQHKRRRARGGHGNTIPCPSPARETSHRNATLLFPMPPRDPADHFARLARLLDLEGRAVADQARERARRSAPADAERAGTSLVDLVIRDEDAGLGGRYLLRLGRRRRSPLPWTRLG